MLKFKVTRQTDYIQGHLRYGHFEAIVEVESEAELKRMIENEIIDEYGCLLVDSYSVDDVDYGDNEYKYKVIE